MVCRQLMVSGIVVTSILVGRNETTAGNDDSKMPIVLALPIAIVMPFAPNSMRLVRVGIK